MANYYSNWNYGYTLAPATEQSRGAYTAYNHLNNYESNNQGWGGNGGQQHQHHHPQQHQHQQQQQQGANIKPQAFVTSSNKTLNNEMTDSQFIGPTIPQHTPSTTQVDPSKALAKLHELAVANKLVERFETIEEPVGGNPDRLEFKVKLFIGTETYLGTGNSVKQAKQNAAIQGLANTRYKTSKEKRFSMFNTARRIGVTATSELHELAAKKGMAVDFKFLEPYNFEFKHSMRMWSKKEMLGNYRVQLNIGGYEFYGQAELPQQAKHNAATQALPIVRNMSDPVGHGHVVAAPAATTEQKFTTSGTAASTASTAATSLTPKAEPISTEKKNVQMLLNEVAMLNSCVPDWLLISETGPPHHKVFTWQLQIGEFTTVGSGPSKKLARQVAAEHMWETLPGDWKQGRRSSGNKRKAAKPSGTPPAKKKGSTGGVVVGTPDSPIVVTATNPVSFLHEYAKKARIADPEFTCVGETVVDTWTKGAQTFKKIEYTIQLDFDNRTYLASAQNKKSAKLSCASEAWDYYRRQQTPTTPH